MAMALNQKRRTWADLLVLIASLWAIAQAIWGPALLSQRSQDQGASTSYVLAVIAGVAGLGGLWLVQKRRGMGRALVALAGVLVLVAPFTYADVPQVVLITAIITGLALLASAKFIGPVPLPEGEGDNAAR